MASRKLTGSQAAALTLCISMILALGYFVYTYGRFAGKVRLDRIGH